MLTTPRRGDISRYLHTKVDEDTAPDAMDSTGVILGQRSEMGLEATALGKSSRKFIR